MIYRAFDRQIKLDEKWRTDKVSVVRLQCRDIWNFSTSALYINGKTVKPIYYPSSLQDMVEQLNLGLDKLNLGQLQVTYDGKLRYMVRQVEQPFIETTGNLSLILQLSNRVEHRDIVTKPTVAGQYISGQIDIGVNPVIMTNVGVIKGDLVVIQFYYKGLIDSLPVFKFNNNTGQVIPMVFINSWKDDYRLVTFIARNITDQDSRDLYVNIPGYNNYRTFYTVQCYDDTDGYIDGETAIYHGASAVGTGLKELYGYGVDALVMTPVPGYVQAIGTVTVNQSISGFKFFSQHGESLNYIWSGVAYDYGMTVVSLITTYDYIVDYDVKSYITKQLKVRSNQINGQLNGDGNLLAVFQEGFTEFYNKLDCELPVSEDVIKFRLEDDEQQDVQSVELYVELQSKRQDKPRK